MYEVNQDHPQLPGTITSAIAASICPLITAAQLQYIYAGTAGGTAYSNWFNPTYKSSATVTALSGTAPQVSVGVVVGGGAQLTMTSSAVTTKVGQPVTFSLQLVPYTTGAATPTGTVTFTDGATTLGTATLVGGAATYSFTPSTAGTHSIQASYGSGNYAGLPAASESISLIAN